MVQPIWDSSSLDRIASSNVTVERLDNGVDSSRRIQARNDYNFVIIGPATTPAIFRSSLGLAGAAKT